MLSKNIIMTKNILLTLYIINIINSMFVNILFFHIDRYFSDFIRFVELIKGDYKERQLEFHPKE